MNDKEVKAVNNDDKLEGNVLELYINVLAIYHLAIWL